MTLFFPLLYQILHTNCTFSHASHAFSEIYKSCGNFNIKFANFGLNLHFCTLNDLHFWESTSKKMSPHRMTPFFNQNLTPNAPYFRSPIGTCTSLLIFECPQGLFHCYSVQTGGGSYTKAMLGSILIITFKIMSA